MHIGIPVLFLYTSVSCCYEPSYRPANFTGCDIICMLCFRLFAVCVGVSCGRRVQPAVSGASGMFVSGYRRLLCPLLAFPDVQSVLLLPIVLLGLHTHFISRLLSFFFDLMQDLTRLPMQNCA